MWTSGCLAAVAMVALLDAPALAQNAAPGSVIGGSFTTGTVGVPSTAPNDVVLDPRTGFVVDPATGLLRLPTTGLLLDPRTATLRDPRTREALTAPMFDPRIGRLVDTRTGLVIQPETGLLVDPVTGGLVDPRTLARSPATRR
jgi:hypothetical protein